MARPSDFPRWADTGGDVVEPTEEKKDVGWVAEEKPPAQYFNWLHKTANDWLGYLDTGGHDEYVKVFGAGDAVVDTSSSPGTEEVEGRSINNLGGGIVNIILDLGLIVGDRVVSVVVYVDEAAGTRISARLVVQTLASAATTAVSDVVASTNSSGDTGQQTITLTPGSGGRVLAAGERLAVYVALQDNGDKFKGAVVTIDHP